MRLRNGFRLTLVGIALICGCDSGKSTFWQLNIDQDRGHPVLDCEKFSVLFDGINLDCQPGRGGASVSLQIDGGGTGVWNLEAFDHTITTSYAAGVNTISFGQHEVRILDYGHRLQVGSSAFGLGAEKKSIVVHADGIVEAK